jgi:DNA replication protein DnaC
MIASTSDKTKTTASPCEVKSPDFSTTWEWFVRQMKAADPDFVIDALNRAVLEATVAYFARDDTECQKRGLNPQKGLFLTGQVGCGKTTLIQFFANAAQRSPFRLITTREVTHQFLQEGYEVIARYGRKSFRQKPTGFGLQLLFDQPKTYCFDDLGVEPNTKRYGNDCNVMAEILLDRYEQFKKYGMLTHLTTNLNAEELEGLYGPRVRSRLREMCNLISFPPEAADRRR